MIAGLAALLIVGANPAWPPRDPQTPVEALKSPDNMPDDPDYRPHADPVVGCRGQLALYAFTPDCTANIGRAERELLGGSGIAVDRAWLWTVGRPEVAIAALDSGIDWSDKELVLRVRLNPGELPLPRTSSRTFSTWDANGDGIFNVQDYTTATGTVVPTVAMIRDPRLLARADKGDSNHNGILDPQDLIAAFSDGADDDHNGFVDDIAGWDFLDNDNDPVDPAPGISHGTRRARDIAATANNGLGGAGACPSCALIPVRVSSNGTAPGSALASAILYATDSGAKVIAAFPSAAGASRFIRGATTYAFRSGVLIVAPAGNGSSLRQEVVWDPDKVLIVSGIGYDDVHLDRANTAVAPDPCSNFGSQVSLSAPARCGDENAAVVAGAMGLLYSAALGIPAKQVAPLVPELSAREAFELAGANADDIPRLFNQDGSGTPKISAKPSPEPGVLIPITVAEGWDSRTGYGRADARRMIDALIQRRVPPEVELISPDWLSVIDPSASSGFAVTGRVDNRRAESASWVLDYAAGDSPRADSFSAVGSGTIGPGASAHVTATVPTDGLFRDPTAAPDEPEAYAITLRLTVSANAGGTTVRGETRRLVFVHRDLEIRPAFPVQLGAAVTASPRFIDLDGDGRDEILVATDDGAIHALDGRGKKLAGWPVLAPLDPLIDPAAPASHRASKAFAERLVPNDTGAAIIGAIAATTDLIAATTAEGQLLAFDAAGKPLPGFPVQLTETGTRSALGHGPLSPLGVTQAPVLIDVDGDGIIDLVQALNDGTVHAVDRTGKEIAGFPLLLSERTGAPAVGDLDGDKKPDLVLAGASTLVVAYGNGMRTVIALPSPTALLRQDMGTAPPSPVLADIDGDGMLEIILATRGRPVLVYRATGGDPIRVATADRTQAGIRSNALRTSDMIFASAGISALGDLDGDGIIDVAAPCSSTSSLLGLDAQETIEQLYCSWSSKTGAFTEGAPHLMGDPAPAGAALADLDANGQAEVIVSDGDGRVEAFAADGTRPRGWPKLTGSWTLGAPAIGDLEGRGQIDVAVATRSGLLFAWRTRGTRKGAPWPGFAHDTTSTGNLSTPTAVFTHVDLGSGCACASAEGGGDALALLFVGAFVFRRLCLGGRRRSPARRAPATPSSRAR